MSSYWKRTARYVLSMTMTVFSAGAIGAASQVWHDRPETGFPFITLFGMCIVLVWGLTSLTTVAREDAGVIEEGQIVTFTYTNHKGERELRRVIPQRFYRDRYPWMDGNPMIHIVDALDVERGVVRSFALQNIEGWMEAYS